MAKQIEFYADEASIVAVNGDSFSVQASIQDEFNLAIQLANYKNAHSIIAAMLCEYNGPIRDIFESIPSHVVDAISAELGK